MLSGKEGSQYWVWPPCLNQMEQRRRLRDRNPKPRAECQAGKVRNELLCAAWKLEKERRVSSEDF